MKIDAWPGSKEIQMEWLREEELDDKRMKEDIKKNEIWLREQFRGYCKEFCNVFMEPEPSLDGYAGRLALPSPE